MATAVPLADLAYRHSVTQTEAARLHGVSKATMRAWMAAPGFPLWTPPGAGHPRIPVPALTAWVKANTIEVAA